MRSLRARFGKLRLEGKKVRVGVVVALIAVAVGQLEAGAAHAGGLAPCATSGYVLTQSIAVQGAPAKVVIYRNPSSGRACAALMRTSSNHARAQMSVTLDSPQQRAAKDAGRFHYYAGPVRVAAPKCVSVSASITWGGKAHSVSRSNFDCHPPAKPRHSTPRRNGGYPARWANAPQDSMADSWGLLNRECTSFVAWKLHETKGINLPHAFGDAINWAGHARNLGWRVDRNPTVGSVAWRTNSHGGGHVAYVSSVHGSSVTIEEYNWATRGGYGKRTVPASSFAAYIHVGR